MTLQQELRTIILELDLINAPDEAYKARFSTFIKKPLCKGETWRDRLMKWADKA